jgi:hypothetical protein
MANEDIFLNNMINPLTFGKAGLHDSASSMIHFNGLDALFPTLTCDSFKNQTGG